MKLELALDRLDGRVHIETQLVEEGIFEVAVRHVQKHSAVSARASVLAHRVIAHGQLLLRQLFLLLCTLGHGLSVHAHGGAAEVWREGHCSCED